LQFPLFRFPGAPAKDKRHALFDSGHIPPRLAIIREALAWLDRYVGPVTVSGSGRRISRSPRRGDPPAL